MKVIIAGSRDGCPNRMLDYAVAQSGFRITELVCGMARGVDQQAHAWATIIGLPIKEFPANWDAYGRGAGPRRNRQMAEYADALIALPGGAGTKNMVEEARKLGLLIYEYG